MATDPRPSTDVRRRFVPTLTEIVNPADLGVDVASAAADIAPADVRLGITAERVLSMLGPELEQRISEAIAQAVNEQMQGLPARVRRTVADVVQDAVDGALRESADPQRPRTDPKI